MNYRQQMIEKVTDLRHAGSTSEQILDAILPQVTTVEQLEEMPDEWILMSEAGVPMMAKRSGAAEIEIIQGRTLTVVWQP